MQANGNPAQNFGEAAKKYTAFRPEYPPEVFDFLLRHALVEHICAVDLGAGSGQATKQLAAFYERVIAIEPDARMANDARLPENVSIEVMPAEEADFAAASVDTVISATAFHWMDQRLICNRVTRWLKPGGVFFPFAFDAYQVEGAGKDLFEVEFEKWIPFRDPRLIHAFDYQAVLEKSAAFASVTPFKSQVRSALSAPEAAGLAATFSFARDYAHSTGNAEGYFGYLANRLAEAGERISFIVPIVGALGVKY